MPHTSPRIARELTRVLHVVGEVLADGRIAVQPEAFMAEAAQLDLLAPAPRRGQGDDADAGDDAAQSAAEAREEGRRLGRAAREQRERSAALWGG